MHQLLVWFPEEAAARTRLNFPTSTAALDSLPRAFANYPGCDRIDVRRGATVVFTLTPSAFLDAISQSGRVAA